MLKMIITHAMWYMETLRYDNTTYLMQIKTRQIMYFTESPWTHMAKCGHIAPWVAVEIDPVDGLSPGRWQISTWVDDELLTIVGINVCETSIKSKLSYFMEIHWNVVTGS